MSSEAAIHQIAGITPDSPLAALLEQRGGIMALTTATEEAVLTPQEPGGLSPSLRAVLACRIARRHGMTNAAKGYLARLPVAGEVRVAPLADPHFDGGDDHRWTVLVRYVDRVTCEPQEVSGDDVHSLQETGWGDADIVRLTELVAFLNYHLRLIAGLQLLDRHP